MASRPRPRRDVAERFWEKVDKSAGPDACWPWTASADDLGYGFFRMTHGETMKKAHRVAWILTHGPVPDDLWVLHRCDNPPCCNPADLFLGSHVDNMADRDAKGRQARNPGLKGEASRLAKLTTEQVVDIRARYVAGGVCQRELGEEYGVSQTAISKITRGVRWA